VKTFLFVLLAGCFVHPFFAADAVRDRQAGRAKDPRLAQITDAPGLPRVLLIGDSISIGYTLRVRELLAGKANVHRPQDNCGSTLVELERLDTWLGQGRWDVIHFNFGLHDMNYVDAKGRAVEVAWGQLKVPLPQYEENLRRIITRLKATGAKLVFATSTPVPTQCVWRYAGEEKPFNEVALKVMKEMNVPVNDLATFARQQAAELQIPDNVHYTPVGYQRLGDKVAAALMPVIASR
jgi:lysophospholipase L1-like esterase